MNKSEIDVSYIVEMENISMETTVEGLWLGAIRRLTHAELYFLSVCVCVCRFFFSVAITSEPFTNFLKAEWNENFLRDFSNEPNRDARSLFYGSDASML